MDADTEGKAASRNEALQLRRRWVGAAVGPPSYAGCVAVQFKAWGQRRQRAYEKMRRMKYNTWKMGRLATEYGQ